MEQDQQAEELSEMNLESAFNLLVNLARNTKLSYQEHSVVDNAIKMVHEELNKKNDEGAVLKE
tara:strand:+ start:2947 stop:3135 length:189 start_codon:yes stop_codon:yes gene_type:complete